MSTESATLALDPARQRTLDRYRGEVASGRAAGFIAASNRSADRMNYRHMLPARTYGEVIGILGRAAALGDRYSAAVAAALPKVSPWLNDWQVMGGVADAFGDFIRSPWTDVREATGPEAGRPSSHVHEVTLRDAVVLHLVLSEMSYALQLGSLPGPGWALLALAHEVDAISLIRSALPRTAEAIA